MDHRRSNELFTRAQAVIPGGVNSPVRAFAAVGGEPVFFARGLGSRLYDVDGNEYLDCVGSWGPLILGHADSRIVSAVTRAATRGTTFGAPTEGEVLLAEMIVAAVPSVEQVRLVNSGTEAAMSALRLARAFTGRDKIIKFEGCYHGHSDGLLAQAGSGVATLGIPGTPGVPASFAAETIVLPYNDPDAVRHALAARGREVAAVIVEPVAANMGVVPPRPGYLAALRELTRAAGALLIFDEVITGFRVGYGGAQEKYGVLPDLTVLGKIIGGGFPVGAYGGREDIMAQMAPVGPVYQAGTLSGNPVGVAAGIETLRALADPAIYDRLEAMTQILQDDLGRAAATVGAEVTINRVGSMLTVFFTRGPVTDWRSASAADTAAYGRFFRAMLEQGVYLPPSQFEAWFVSAAHAGDELRRIATASQVGLARGILVD